MPKISITLEFIAGLAARAPASGSVNWFDAELPGFLLEQRSSGGATYYYRYRDATRAIRLCRIGRLSDVPLAQARAQAYAMRQLVQAGGDPKREYHRFAESPLLVDFMRVRYVPYVSARKRSCPSCGCTTCATVSPAFWSTPAAACTRCRSCWATPTSAPPAATPTSAASVCARRSRWCPWAIRPSSCDGVPGAGGPVLPAAASPGLGRIASPGPGVRRAVGCWRLRGMSLLR